MQVSDYITCVDCNSEGKIPTVHHTMNWCKWVWMGFALHQSNKIMSEITGQSSRPCMKHTHTSLDGLSYFLMPFSSEKGR